MNITTILLITSLSSPAIPIIGALQWSPSGAEGSGNWDTSSSTWFGTEQQVWTDGSSAIFGGLSSGTAGTVTVTSPLNVAGIHVNAAHGAIVPSYPNITGGGYTLTGATLTMTNPLIYVSVTDGGIDIKNVLAGSAGLLVQGGGAEYYVFLSGANTYTGGTTTNGAMVIIGDGGSTGSLGSGAVSVGSGTLLTFFRSGTYTLTENISGRGYVCTTGGGGRFIVSGISTIDPAFGGYIAGRRIDGSPVSDSSTLQFATTASLFNSSSGSWTAPLITAHSGHTLAFNVGGAGEFTTGNITTLLTNLGGSVTTGGLLSGSSIGFDTTNASGGAFTVSNVIADTTGSGGGPIGVSKFGAGTLTLSGANTYTGPMTCNAGTLAHSGTFSTTSLVVVFHDNGSSAATTGLITLPSSPALTGKTVNIIPTALAAGATAKAVVSWAGTATGTPTLQWNGTTQTSGTPFADGARTVTITYTASSGITVTTI